MEYFIAGVVILCISVAFYKWSTTFDESPSAGIPPTQSYKRPDPLKTDPRAHSDPIPIHVARSRGPYDTLSPLEARMLVETEKRLSMLITEGPTEEIRKQAKKVLSINYKLKDALDADSQAEKISVMEVLNTESTILFAMLTEFGIEAGTVQEHEIPIEMRVALAEYRMHKEASKLPMPKSDTELGANLDFDMPMFGKINPDEM